MTAHHPAHRTQPRRQKATFSTGRTQVPSSQIWYQYHAAPRNSRFAHAKSHVEPQNSLPVPSRWRSVLGIKGGSMTHEGNLSVGERLVALFDHLGISRTHLVGWGAEIGTLAR